MKMKSKERFTVRLIALIYRIMKKSQERVEQSWMRECCIVGKNSIFFNTAKIINPLEKDRIHIGENTYVRGEIALLGHGGKITIGDYCYLGQNSYVWSGMEVYIGNRVLISHNCNIFDNDIHPLDACIRHEQYKKIITIGQPKEINLNDEKIIIEDDVLICANVTILKGVHIGEGAIIGAGSVVIHDIPAYVVVHGNPAKIYRKLNQDI